MNTIVNTAVFSGIPGITDKEDAALVAFLHLVADDATDKGETFVAGKMRAAAIALDEYRGGQRLAYPHPGTGYTLHANDVRAVEIDPSHNKPDLGVGDVCSFMVAEANTIGAGVWASKQGVVSEGGFDFRTTPELVVTSGGKRYSVIFTGEYYVGTRKAD